MTLAVTVLYAVLAVAGLVAARDVTRRGGNGEMVGLGIFFVPPLGLALWWAARRGNPEAADVPVGCPVSAGRR